MERNGSDGFRTKRRYSKDRSLVSTLLTRRCRWEIRSKMETKDDKDNKKKRIPTFIDRVKRLLTIMQMCQYGRPKASELADICKTHKRTIFRDFSILRKLGVIISTNVNTAQVHISEPVYLPPMQLTVEEAFTMLTLCFEAAKGPKFPFMDSAGDAIYKLLGTFPPHIIDRLRPLGSTLLIRKSPMNSHDGSKAVFNYVRESMVKRKAIRIRYKSPSEPDDFFTLLYPYQIMFARRAWYVIGRSSLHRQTRTFHIGRILQIEETDNPYQVPRGFSIERYLGNAWCLIPEQGPDSDVVVRFSKQVAQNVSEVSWHHTQKIVKRQSDGSIDFHVRVSGLNEISWWILGYGKEAEVLQPQALRDKIKGHVVEMYKKYVTGETSVLNQSNMSPSVPSIKHPLQQSDG